MRLVAPGRHPESARHTTSVPSYPASRNRESATAREPETSGQCQ
uniref:Drosophila melanogaster acetylcholinesterase (AChE) n=1 Tax=Drosophila melanogaster TaxID=7227 RepID=A2NUF1_DROME|nr:unnamed protein product [Drosophila melanogaster]